MEKIVPCDVHFVRYVTLVHGQYNKTSFIWACCVFSEYVYIIDQARGQYPAILTELAWSIKDLLYGIKSTEKNDLRTCLFSSTEKEPS